MNSDAFTGRLGEVQISSFEKNGFLAIDRLLDDEDLRPIEEEYAALLDQVAPAHYAMGRRDRPVLDDPCKRLALRVVELGRWVDALRSISPSGPSALKRST